jgi:Ca-activated chloride channel family protein
MSLVLATCHGNKLLPERDGRIPLKAVEVHGELIDFVGKIKISQTYTNNYDTSIEAKYMFNLDENSVITGMSLTIGERVLVSHISEKSEAKQTYEKAKTEKKTTCLLEKESNGVYTMNLGNIVTGQEIKVEFEYLTKLVCTDEGQMKFVLPMNISPKYDASQKTAKDRVATRSTTNAMVYSDLASPFDFLVNLHWKSDNGILKVKSLTNEIEVHPVNRTRTLGGDVKEVTITSKTAQSDGDFNIFVKTAEEPKVYVSMQADYTYLMISQRVPDEYAEDTAKDYIIVVDRSGSMSSGLQGWSGNHSKSKTKMDYAREATKLFIQSLPEGSKFNIVSFGSEHSKLFDESVDYTEETRQSALNSVEGFGADMGGTELFNCLSDALCVEEKGPKKIDLKKRKWKPSSSISSDKQEPEESDPPLMEKVVILLTDGDVGNMHAVTQVVKEHQKGCRVFTIGIGQDVNRSLINKIAKASNACSEVLIDNPDVSSVVIKMLDLSSKSYYKEMRVSFASKNSKKKSETVTIDDVIYPNQFLSFFHKMTTKDFLSCPSVELSCRSGATGEILQWQFPLNHAVDSSQENSFIPQLYAANYIKALEDKLRGNEDTSFVQTKIVDASVRYSIMNERTSFVVVDEQTMKNDSELVTVVVPQYSSGSGERKNATIYSLVPSHIKCASALPFDFDPRGMRKCAPATGGFDEEDCYDEEEEVMIEEPEPRYMIKCGPAYRNAPSPNPSPTPSRYMIKCAPATREVPLGTYSDEDVDERGDEIKSKKDIKPSVKKRRTVKNVNDSKNAKADMSTPFLGTDEERMDALLQHKKVKGSFALCSDALKILNVKQATVASLLLLIVLLTK